MARVLDEILPWISESYGAASDAAHIAFGGSSFGGICTLWACMHHSDRFGAALVESPSLWIADEKFLRCVGGCLPACLPGWVG
jgi:enterochelin esterase-like enzyme